MSKTSVSVSGRGRLLERGFSAELHSLFCPVLIEILSISTLRAFKRTICACHEMTAIRTGPSIQRLLLRIFAVNKGTSIGSSGKSRALRTMLALSLSYS